jgi:hypothetical protein
MKPKTYNFNEILEFYREKALIFIKNSKKTHQKRCQL